jgi:serine/threonine-protein kinase RsbW
MDAEEPSDRMDQPVRTSRHPVSTAEAADETASATARLDLKWTLPREPASVAKSRRLFDTALTLLGVAAACRTDIALILTEACTNAVVHAAGETYHVNLTVDHRRCVVEVIDSGVGLYEGHPGSGRAINGPPEAVTEGGRGMFVIRALSDAAEWIRAQPQGLIVRMCKQLVWTSDTYNPSTGPHAVAG